jgi:hypothetical protein
LAAAAAALFSAISLAMFVTSGEPDVALKDGRSEILAI